MFLILGLLSAVAGMVWACLIVALINRPGLFDIKPPIRKSGSRDDLGSSDGGSSSD